MCSSDLHDATDGVAQELVARGIEVHRVGDAEAVGYIEGAVRGAWTWAEGLR